MDVARLHALNQRLNKIIEAKKINSELQRFYMQRIQVIDSQLYILQSQSRSQQTSVLKENKTNFSSLSEGERKQLVSLFWKKRYDKSNFVKEDKSTKQGKTQLEKRRIYMNFERNPMQKALLLEGTNKDTAKRSISLPIYLNPTLYDCIRYYIIMQIYGEKFQVRKIYPNFNVRNIISILKKVKPNCNLEEIGFNCEKLQKIITDALSV